MPTIVRSGDATNATTNKTMVVGEGLRFVMVYLATDGQSPCRRQWSTHYGADRASCDTAEHQYTINRNDSILSDEIWDIRRILKGLTV